MEKIAEKIKLLSSEMGSLITETEEIYASIYEYLPEIEKEIDLTLEEINILLEYFTFSEAKQIEGSYRIADVLEEIANKFEKNRSKMIEEEEIKKVKRYFAASDRDDNLSIDTLIGNVQGIQVRIEDIELISLNAIIYSAKLGDEGRAFSVIANNIIKLSNNLSKLYQAVLERSKKLETWDNQFINGLNQLLDYNEQLQIQQVKEFENLFNIMFDSLESVSALLSDMVENIEQAIEPISELMVSIQVQDIIKQNMQFLDDVLLQLEEDFSDFNNLEKREDKLDILIFAIEILELVIDAIESIEDNFIESIHGLSSLLVQIESDLVGLKEDGQVITNFLNGTGDEKSTIGEIFASVYSFIADFKSNLKQIEFQTEKLSASNKQFDSLISNLEDDVAVIKKEVGFLNKLELVSKIELARIELGNNFTADLSGIVSELENDIKNNDQLVTGLKDKLTTDLKQFEKMLTTNNENIVAMMDLINKSQDEFELIENLISDAITALGNSSNNLIEEVYKLKEKINVGMEIAHFIGDIKDNLYQLKSDIRLEKEEITDSYTLEEMDIYNQELKEILTEFERRFKGINKEKEIMKSQESNEEEGDLVLF